MMQGSSHIPVLAHSTWPIKATQSNVSGVKTSSQDAKKLDGMNGLHKPRHLNNVPTSRSGGCDSVGANNLLLNSPPSTRVRWTVKNITRKEDGKQLSNISSWLSSQKLEDKAMGLKSPSSGGYSSGFDLAKLYPELSSKLGLIKSVSNNITSKSSLENQLNSKGASGGRQGSSLTNHVHHELTSKTSIRAIASPGSIYRNSLQVDKSSSSIHSSPHNDIKRYVTKPHETLALTKLSEDKLKKVLSCQALNNKASLNLAATAAAVKIETKTKTHNKCKPSTVSLFDAVCDKTFPCNAGYPFSSVGSVKPNKISLLPRDPPHPLPNLETLSPTQLRVHKLYQDYYAYKSNLFPLGYDSSASDASDDDNGESITTNHDCLLRCKEDNTIDPSFTHNPALLKQPYRQQVISAKERLQLHEHGLKRCWALTRALLEAARANPDSTASTVAHFVRKLQSILPPKKKQSRTRSSLLMHRQCVYEGETGGMCGHRAVPGTRHCLRHITYNVDQQLFSQCTAKRQDNALCRIPTLNLLHDFPLCPEHAKQHHSAPSVVPPLDGATKAKRARKKSKMPILSRYGKRNKKRRRSSLGSSSIVPSTSVRPPINSPGVCLGSPHSTSPLTPHTSPTFSTPCSDPAGGGDDSELEADELEGMVGELPLEAKDLQDVLNKIPEHEFSQILYGADGKICEGTEDEDRKPSRPGVTANTSKAPDPPLPSLCLDEGALGELISSSFNQQELNTISQVLSNMVGEEGLNLGSEYQEAQETSALIVPSFQGVTEPSTSPPVYLSEDSNSESVHSHPEGLSPPAGTSNSLLHPNSKLKVKPTL